MNFGCIPPNQTVILASTIAIELSCGKNPTEISALADFISAIGQNLSSIASQSELNELCNKN